MKGRPTVDIIEVTRNLPADLARDAAEFGILDAPVLVALVRDELDRQVMEMVNDEIHKYRIAMNQTSD